jgi:RNA recognition motif-containing protein
MKLFICNLSYKTTELDLVNFFNQYIKEQISIECVKIVKNVETKISRGFAYVSLYSEEDLNSVLNLNGSVYNERQLRISLSK